MDSLRLNKFEYLVILAGVVILPLMSLLLGSSLVAMFFEGAEMLEVMYGERILFLLVAILVFYFLKKIKVLNIQSRQYISLKATVMYVVQCLFISLIVINYFDKEKGLYYIIFFIILNYVIAWEEEFVYRLLVPDMLKIYIYSHVVICFLQAVIFTFIAHQDGTFVENLIYRVPLALFLYVVRERTGSIFLPTSIHAIWNIGLEYL